MPYVLIVIGCILILIASVKAIAVAYVSRIRFVDPGIEPSLRTEIRSMLSYYLAGFVLSGLGFYLIDISGS